MTFLNEEQIKETLDHIGQIEVSGMMALSQAMVSKGILLIKQYVKDKKGIELGRLDLSQFNVQLYSLLLNKAREYYEAKYCATRLFSNEGELLKYSI